MAITPDMHLKVRLKCCILVMQSSALHIAAREGHLLALYHLVTIHSVDVNVKDGWGWTPVDSAVCEEQWPAAVLLMSWGGVFLA
jgi:ankyrin repeat protein